MSLQSLPKIPVLIFPASLKFYLGSRTTHKQLLTLYNPYDIAVRFKVFSNAPNKYVVIDPEGSIAPKTCVDIVIRHTVPVSTNCNIVDKFRISMHDHATRQLIGRRDIEATLLPGERDNSSNEGDNFQSFQSDRGSLADEQSLQHRQFLPHRIQPPAQSPNFAILVGIICIVALLLPTQNETVHTNIPTYLHLSVNFKLVLSYVLGLVSMVIFRP